LGEKITAEDETKVVDELPEVKYENPSELLRQINKLYEKTSLL